MSTVQCSKNDRIAAAEIDVPITGHYYLLELESIIGSVNINAAVFSAGRLLMQTPPLPAAAAVAVDSASTFKP